MSYKETKEWLLNHVNKIYLSDSQEYYILYDLIKKHPSYGTWKFQIPYSFKIIFKKCINLYVSFININNKNTKYRIVSWVSCCKKISKVDPLTSAMRQSINKQINNYKRNHVNKQCIMCYSVNNIEVDHIIKFADLKNDFINKTPKIPNIFDYHPKRGYYLFKKSDYDFKKHWQKYHLKNACYQYLCSTCNKIY